MLQETVVTNVRQCGCQDTRDTYLDTSYGESWEEPGLIRCEAHTAAAKQWFVGY